MSTDKRLAMYDVKVVFDHLDDGLLCLWAAPYFFIARGSTVEQCERAKAFMLNKIEGCFA